MGTVSQEAITILGMAARPTVLFSGMIGATPGQGGATWAVLQYLLGFRQLGWDVWFVEPAPLTAADDVSAVLDPYGFSGRWAVLASDGTTAGAGHTELLAAARRADLLVNVAGMLTDPALLEPVPVRVYLDLDPAFVQLWHTVEGVDMRLDGHTHFVTVSDAVGRTIPDCGRTWLDTLPPVALPCWPVADRLERNALTTVGNWRGYGSIHHAGVHYGQKAHSLRPLLELPTRVSVPIVVALAIHPDEASDIAALAANGWQLVDPAVIACSPGDYRRFIAGSLGELGIAKSGYVVSDSGWFSDRSACYLASGRPVVAMETGLSRRLPVGKGLLTFHDIDSAVVAVEQLVLDYESHRSAAREIAETHLDASVVLGRLLEAVLR
jgi:hypothetical protein